MVILSDQLLTSFSVVGDATSNQILKPDPAEMTTLISSSSAKSRASVSFTDRAGFDKLKGGADAKLPYVGLFTEGVYSNLGMDV